MSKAGTFQERFNYALSMGQTLQIQRREIEEGEDYFDIQVLTHTEEFGTLSEGTSVNLSDMTPGKLVKAIEDTAGVMTSAIKMMEKRGQQIAPPITEEPAVL